VPVRGALVTPWRERRRWVRNVGHLLLLSVAAPSSLRDACAGERAAHALRPMEIRQGGGHILVRFEGGEMGQPRSEVMRWIEDGAVAVVAYYGRFPIREVQVAIAPIDGRAVHGNTRTYNGSTTIRVHVGRDVSVATLAEHWVVTHELVHLAFPEVADAHHWIEEGLATYVEPIARVQAGQLAPEAVWQQLVDGLPRGLPEVGDAGLDFTHTWGRTYWGGALFCLLAEIGIRDATANRHGLQDALRGILRAGGSMTEYWPLERALHIGDTATATTVMTSLYRDMRARPVDVDLDALWRRLGVRRNGSGVTFDDTAPLASTRIAVTSPHAGSVSPQSPSPLR